MHFSKMLLNLKITVDLSLSAGKLIIGKPDCNYFKALNSFLERLSLEG